MGLPFPFPHILLIKPRIAPLDISPDERGIQPAMYGNLMKPLQITHKEYAVYQKLTPSPKLAR